MTMPLPIASSVIEFINHEADLLDNKEYREWLGLWHHEGLYIVPVDVHETDFANTLNFAYDDAEMRELRVARLLSGESVSSLALDRTVRQVSRFRVLEENDERIRLRYAMTLNEVRAGRLLICPGEVELELVRQADGLKILRKVVRLLHASSHLPTVAFIF